MERRVGVILVDGLVVKLPEMSHMMSQQGRRKKVTAGAALASLLPLKNRASYSSERFQKIRRSIF